MPTIKFHFRGDWALFSSFGESAELRLIWHREPDDVVGNTVWAYDPVPFCFLRRYNLTVVVKDLKRLIGRRIGL